MLWTRNFSVVKFSPQARIEPATQRLEGWSTANQAGDIIVSVVPTN